MEQPKKRTYGGLDEWFRATILKARELRGIKTPLDRADAILNELSICGYTGNQAKNAEHWILNNPFSEIKKQNGLELSDFFPNAANFAKQLPEDAILTTERDLERIRQEAYRKGRDEERLEQAHKRRQTGEEKEIEGSNTEWKKTVAEFARQRVEDEKTHDRLRAELKLTKNKLNDAEYALRRLQKHINQQHDSSINR